MYPDQERQTFAHPRYRHSPKDIFEVSLLNPRRVQLLPIRLPWADVFLPMCNTLAPAPTLHREPDDSHPRARPAVAVCRSQPYIADIDRWSFDTDRSRSCRAKSFVAGRGNRP